MGREEYMERMSPIVNRNVSIVKFFLVNTMRCSHTWMVGLIPVIFYHKILLIDFEFLPLKQQITRPLEVTFFQLHHTMWYLAELYLPIMGRTCGVPWADRGTHQHRPLPCPPELTLPLQLGDRPDHVVVNEIHQISNIWNWKLQLK